MIEKILQWGGTILAIIGVIFMFLEAIGSIRKHSNPRLSILSLVFLSVSLIGYLLTEIILRSKGLPAFFSCIWLVFLWAYLICNLVSAIKLSKQTRKDKQEQQQTTEEQSADTGNETAALNESAEQPDVEPQETEAAEQVDPVQNGEKK